MRRKASEKLGNSGDSQAITALVAALKDKRSDVREAAALALGKMGGPQSIEALSILFNEDYHIHGTALEALGMIGEPALDALANLLKDERHSARKDVIEAIGKVQGSRSTDLLGSALIDTQSWVRTAAGKALEQRNWKPPDEAAKIRMAIAQGKWEEVVPFGSAAIEPLRIALQDALTKSEAVKTVCKIGGALALDPLVLMLEDNSQYVRKDAAEGLGNLGDVRATEFLLSKANDKDESVRAAVFQALGNLKDPKALQVLSNGFRDERWNKNAAANALAKLGTTGADVLLNAMSDSSSAVRSLAAEALGKTGDARAVEPLALALKDESSMVRSAAAAALANFGVAAVEPLLKILGEKGKDYNTLEGRKVAADALGKIGSQQAVPQLAEALQEPALRVHAARALHALGDPIGLNHLVAVAVDKSASKDQREDALRALCSIPEDSSIDVLLQIAKDNANPEKFRSLANDALKAMRTGRSDVEAVVKAGEQTERIRRGAGHKKCDRCATVHQWLLKISLSGMNMNYVVVNCPANRPGDLGGWCQKCKESFCAAHTRQEQCVICGSRLIRP